MFPLGGPFRPCFPSARAPRVRRRTLASDALCNGWDSRRWNGPRGRPTHVSCTASPYEKGPHTRHDTHCQLHRGTQMQKLTRYYSTVALGAALTLAGACGKGDDHATDSAAGDSAEAATTPAADSSAM